MNKKRQLALNKLFNFCIALGLLFVWGSIDFFRDSNNAWGLGFGVIALFLIVLPVIFTPYCYAFDNEGVSLCYIFLPVERYLWKDIYSIEVEDIKLGPASSASIFDFFYAGVFSIKGNNAYEKAKSIRCSYPSSAPLLPLSE